MNSIIDEATLRELYLLPFEIAVEESDPWSIMSAYNQVNGITSSAQQHVQNDIVKHEWRWSGLIMSDWYATKSIDAAAGGLDLVMPGPRGLWGDKLITAVEAGQVAESAIDDHVVRVLRLADRVGRLGGSRNWPPQPAPDSPERKDQLKRLTAAGITVLTNNDRVLPIDRQSRSHSLAGMRRRHRDGRRLSESQSAIPEERRRGARCRAHRLIERDRWCRGTQPGRVRSARFHR